jgi:hypothetical protein
MKGQIFNIRISVQNTLATLQERWRSSKTRRKFEILVKKGKNLRNEFSLTQHDDLE